jgi:hypothetical protein
MSDASADLPWSIQIDAAYAPTRRCLGVAAAKDGKAPTGFEANQEFQTQVDDRGHFRATGEKSSARHEVVI